MCVFITLGFAPRSETATVTVFNLLRSYQPVFPSRRVISSEGPTFPTSSPALPVCPCEVVSCCRFDVCFFKDHDIGRLFMCFRMSFLRDLMLLFFFLETFPKLHHRPWNQFQTSRLLY